MLVKTGLTRRAFLAWTGSVAATLFLKGCPVAAGEVASVVGADGEEDVPESSRTIGQHFSGESLAYTMGFLWFNKAGSCTVTFEETSEAGIYEATIAGQTHGVIGAFTRFRRDILSASMQEVDNGKRFRPLEFCEDVIVGSKQRKKTTRFDYENHQITIIKERKGKIKEKTLPLDETYCDPITASYNFRFGGFGPIERGRQYVVKTVPEKELTEIRVAIASLEEEKEKKRPKALRGENAFFVYLQLDKDLIRSTSGKIEGWLSETMIPIEGRIRDVVLFGDITGRLSDIESMQPIPIIP